MARGKYKNAAEARQVRESAVSEVEAGRRAIARLTAENAELRETLSKVRQELTEKLATANALMAAGASGEVIALREELAHSREQTAGARRHVAQQVATLMHRNDVKATYAFYAACAELLDLSVQDLMPRAREINRNSRRATTKTLRLLAEVQGELTPSGLAAAFEGFEDGQKAGSKAPRP